SPSTRPGVNFFNSKQRIGALNIRGFINIVGEAPLQVSTPGLSITQTWNNSNVVFTALKVNATRTASSGSSKVFDFQIAGTTMLALVPSADGLLMFGGSSSNNSTGGAYGLVGGLGGSSQQFIGWGGSTSFMYWTLDPNFGMAIAGHLGFNTGMNWGS